MNYLPEMKCFLMSCRMYILNILVEVMIYNFLERCDIFMTVRTFIMLTIVLCMKSIALSSSQT